MIIKSKSLQEMKGLESNEILN